MKLTPVTLLIIGIAWCAQQDLWGFEKIVIMADERPPFHFRDAKGTIVGVASETVHCALKSMNQPYQIEIVPWRRAQVSVEKGIADAFFAASQNAERDKYAVLSEMIIDQYWNWYLLKHSPLNPKATSFKANTVVMSWFGSNSDKWLHDQGYNVGNASKSLDMLVRMLKSGRVDAIFGSNFAIEAAIEESNQKNNIRIVKGMHKPMGVYLSKTYLAKNIGFLEQFNTAITLCREKVP